MLRGYSGISHIFYYFVMRNYINRGLIDGGASYCSFISKHVHSLVVPLPPILEQNQVAGKIDELLYLLEIPRGGYNED
jgi:hypothetical protein